MQFDSLPDDSAQGQLGFDAMVDDGQKFGTAGQQALTALEGFGSSATFGLSGAVQNKLDYLGVPGMTPEERLGRREENPISYGAGQVAGIFTPPVARVLGAVGKGAGALVQGTGTAAKVGSSVAALAAENAAFQVGDEVSKMFASDPNQSLGTAMANVGLSGIIGGAFGVVPPLWQASSGKVTEVLNALKSKAGGIDGEISTPVREALERAGVEFPPEIKSGLSDDPVIQNAFKTLQQSDTTKSGVALQQSYEKVRHDLSDSMVSSLGKDAKYIKSLADVSDAKVGTEIGDILAKEVAEVVDPITSKLDKLKKDFADTDLVPDTVLENPRTIVDPQDLTGVPKVEMVQTKVPGTTATLAEKIGQMAIDQGWMAADEGADRALVNMVMRNLPKQKSLRDLSNLISSVGKRGEELSSMTNFGPSRTAGMINRVLRDGESEIIASKLGQKNPGLADEFRATLGEYRNASLLREELQSKIGVKASLGRYSDAIKEFASGNSEKLLARLTKKDNADLLRLLQERFPNTADAIRQYQLDSLLAKSAEKAKAGEVINPKTLIKGIDDLSPEMKEFAIPAGAVDRIRSVGTILEQFEKAPHNFSNTARTMDRLLEFVPGTAVGMATIAAGGNPVLAGVLGFLTKYLAKDAPDAIRLSILKFLGSREPVNSAAFKAMTDLADNVAKGERALSKSTRAVLKPGGTIPHKEVSQGDRDKLDKKLLAYKTDESLMLGIGGETGYYLPEYGTAAAEGAVNAINYLNSIRPEQQKSMPLDADAPVDPAEKQAFNRALDISEDPLMVLHSVKNGTVVSQDLVTLQNVAPGLYARMREKLTMELANRQADEEPIPYKTRLGLALFLGMPLDSTMTPEGMMAAQPKPQMAPEESPVNPTATGMQKLSKVGASNATRGQQRQMDRAKRIS